MTQIFRIICSSDGYRRCNPLLHDAEADDARQYVLQILFVPPALPLTSHTTALLRQCVANSHSFTAQTHSTAITLLFPRGRPAGERSQCYDDASARKLYSSLVQGQGPKPILLNNLTPD